MKEVIDEMNETAQSGRNDANIGHYVDKELAYAYIKIKNYDKAIEHATLEYNRRPLNIDVNEAVAWAYYNKGYYAKALPYIQTALKTKSKNPTLLCYAGLIYAKNGNSQAAKSLLKQALQNHPVIALGPACGKRSCFEKALNVSCECVSIVDFQFLMDSNLT